MSTRHELLEGRTGVESRGCPSRSIRGGESGILGGNALRFNKVQPDGSTGTGKSSEHGPGL